MGRRVIQITNSLGIKWNIVKKYVVVVAGTRGLRRNTWKAPDNDPLTLLYPDPPAGSHGHL
jgi:hypothetical protein